MRLFLALLLLLAASACAYDYPHAALARGSYAALQCEVTADGYLDHCVSLAPEPPGYAFAPPR